MNFWRSVEGTMKAELTGADPGGTLNALNQSGFPLMLVKWVDDLTVTLRCSRRDRRRIAEICVKQGDSVRFYEEKGLPVVVRTVFQRPVLTAGILFFLIMTLFLPTRVLFFRVQGNEALPARRILEAAEDCGIRFGVSRRAVRSEKMKNALLKAMPELKWAGINTAGCTAVISVRERAGEADKEAVGGAASIVAARDGYVTSCTVTRGNGLCAPGQVVHEGQVLISGYTDCGIHIQVTRAEGEVYAETDRDVEAIMPSETLIRVAQNGHRRQIGLIIGKKRINLWKDSGIWDATCGRMYEEYYITLPGGFRLPVRLAVETLTDWKTRVSEVTPEVPEAALKAFARKSVLDQTIAGKILQEKHDIAAEDDRFVLKSRFLCSEMIGRVITEEIGEANGKTD